MESSALARFHYTLQYKKAIPTQNNLAILETKCIDVNLKDATCAAFLFNCYVEIIFVVMYQYYQKLDCVKRLLLLCASATSN